MPYIDLQSALGAALATARGTDSALRRVVSISVQWSVRVAELSGDAERRRVEVLLKCRLGLGHKPIDGLLPGHQLYQPLFHDGAQRGAGVVIKDAEVALLES